MMSVKEPLISTSPAQADLPVGTILIVEDDPSVLRLVSYLLEKEGHTVETAANGQIGWEKIQAKRYDLVLTDIRMPVMDGLEMLALVKKQRPETVVVVLSAFGNKDTAIESLKLGAYDYLKKPLENQRLRAVVRHLVAKKCVASTSLSESGHHWGLVGHSTAMAEVFREIRGIAPYRTPVLILGERGVGKKQVAKAIHLASPWASGSFAVFHCEDTDSASLEGMLWGRPGTSQGTGAADSQGVFERAQGGSILLAELGFLSPMSQVRLLDSLKSSSVRLGAPKLHLNQQVRFMSTTNTAIRQAVETGQFSEDLMYRLRGVVIEVPPLRARPEDIVAMAHLFAAEAGVSDPAAWFSPLVIERLQAYRWPGNGRELREVVDDLSRRVRAREVEVSDLGARFRGAVGID
jgi:DNA-binding NtrC family response regulator